MADYFGNLTQEQKNNIAFITKRMNEKGITNPYTQSAILSVVSKETGFIPKRESSYSTTSNARIRQIFGDRVSKFTEPQLTALKANDVNFFNTVYGLPKYGQTFNEGYKFRGGGLNQLTFKGNFKKAAELTGHDLINNPDLINKLDIATDVIIAFYKNAFATAPKEKLKQYNTDSINGFKNITDSMNAIYHANAGWGKSTQVINKDVTGGKAKADSRVGGFFDMIKDLGSKTIEKVKTEVSEVKKKPFKAVIITSILIVAGYIIIKAIKKQWKT